MKEIPIIDQPEKNVYQNLTKLEPYLVTPTNDNAFIFKDVNLKELITYTKNVRKSLSLKDKWTIFNKFLFATLCSNQRLKGELSDISWADFIQSPNKIFYDYCVRSIGPYYGVDLYKASMSSIWEVLENTHGPATLENNPLRVMNGPTNVAWFNHWHNHLNKKERKKLLETLVIDIKIVRKLLENKQIGTKRY